MSTRGREVQNSRIKKSIRNKCGYVAQTVEIHLVIVSERDGMPRLEGDTRRYRQNKNV